MSIKMNQNLQTFFLLLVLSLVLYTQQQNQDPVFKETFKKYRGECVKEVGIDEEFVKKVWKENHFPNDDKLKCYFKCMNMKLGVLDDKGEVIDDKLKFVASHYHDASTETEIVVECGDIAGANLCETAFKLMTCIKNATLD